MTMSRDGTEMLQVGFLKNKPSLDVTTVLSLLSNQCNGEDHTTATALASTTSSQMESVCRAMTQATVLMQGLQP